MIVWTKVVAVEINVIYMIEVIEEMFDKKVQGSQILSKKLMKEGYSGIWVSTLVAVMKSHEKNNLKGKGFRLAHSCSLQSTTVGESQWQKLEGAGHITFILAVQQYMTNANAQLALSSPRSFA